MWLNPQNIFFVIFENTILIVSCKLKLKKKVIIYINNMDSKQDSLINEKAVRLSQWK